ncbi:MAG: hypothetical protein VYC34_03095, partial [Planctomycetota bacterium]|nr:hypothetical protein [Planctomycetota bacterium]
VFIADADGLPTIPIGFGGAGPDGVGGVMLNGWPPNSLPGIPIVALDISNEKLGPPLNTFTAPCPADLDGDGNVGPADLANLLGSWGQGGPADLDGDGVVGVSDLAEMLGSWGPCP